MATRLILLRHGDAAWPTVNESDRDRPLTERGEEQVSRWLDRFAETSWSIDSIVSSPAQRAIATAGRVGERLGLSVAAHDVLYDGSMREIQQWLTGTPDTVTTLLAVGHNPTFSALASTLAAVSVSLGTANGVLLESAESGWTEAPLLDASWALHAHLAPH